LDFTLKTNIDIEKVIKKSTTGLTIFGCESTERKKKEDRLGVTYMIKIKGPLFTGVEQSHSFIRLEISKREQVILPAVVKTITPIYNDLPPYSVSVMNPSEIMAEKVRAILTRNKARDIYDLWFLIQKKITTTNHIISSKLNYYDIKFNLDLLKKSIKEKEKIWDKEMKQLVPLYLKFEDVFQEIFSQKFIEE
jgi:predicted nucleotidyltransferase component of viral defense system